MQREILELRRKMRLCAYSFKFIIIKVFIILIMIISLVIPLECNENNIIIVRNSEKMLKSDILMINIEENKEEFQENVENIVNIEEKTQNTNNYYRLTSYWSGDDYDTGGCTGSGLCEDNFQINDKGWYTYNGKLVIAGATTYLQNRFGVKDNRHYFNYYETLTLIIDGTSYDAIILDSCGASMYMDEERIDLFVSSSSSSIDRGYRGNNMVEAIY